MTLLRSDFINSCYEPCFEYNEGDLMQFIGVVGVSVCNQGCGSHSVKLMGELTIDTETRVEKLKKLKKLAGIDELVYLATCNRVEFIFTATNSTGVNAVRNKILDFFFQNKDSQSISPNDLYCKFGLESVRHLFSVASAINSLVIGEAQILGQVKDAYFYALENDLVGDGLGRIFQQAFRVAKKIRTETEMGKKSVSMVSLVTSLIKDVVEKEGKVPVALIGVGEMSHKLADFLTKNDVSDLVFVNRTVNNTQPFVEKYGGRAISLNDFLNSPPDVRIICTATSSPDPIFTRSSTENLLAQDKDLLLIDLAIPCDVDDELENSVDNRLKIYNIPALKTISEQNRKQRFRDVDKARAIISAEVVRYHQSLIENELKPVFSVSYQQAKEYADKGLESLFNKNLSHLEESDRKRIAHLVNKLVSYSTFLPARTMADRISSRNNSDTGAELMSIRYGQLVQVEAFRKGA
ncbi:MAG: glutamyl-tRNA reductase [Candidatus Zixiibacteriota bacterium]